MTRYGFAIKALPQGGKPFGEDDDENEETAGTEEASLDEAGPGVSDTEPSGGAEEDLPEDPTASPAVPAEEPTASEGDPAEPPAPGAPPEGEATGEDPNAAPAPPDDDSRPWAGDMYTEGDETSPDDAFAAYTGVDGEQAWLDQATDGTLTGWVRDGDGQVWRYTDADAWATDVDGAQMTRTHGPEGGDGTTGQVGPDGQAPPAGRGVQDPMFSSQ
ncbi:hypothetical protein QJ054_33960 [Streptomyces sp. AN-3]|uniref:hypothetical protein n=1 Tax=Streptomyces sp. AN-3 TaxID=3044177 RepID=UPI00249AF025|nr:hypothetical protein [Streptomyces sp. AN-3]MDI3102044.1 hypothetical protein [Streptomyces sp. AN-3]